MTNKLYLIPTPLGEYDPAEVLPAPVLGLIPTLKCFVVEEIRTARRFLSKAGLKGQIDSLEFHILNEHSTPEQTAGLVELFERSDVGLISEAGLPAVADPGASLVALCHEKGIPVVPLTGPSSLMLALMGSGLNGQSFAFHGYVSAKSDERKTELRSLEKASAQLRQSQIIIETPYRNDALLSDMKATLQDGTRLCVAADLTLPTQLIRTLRISQWKQLKDFSIGKHPCVFIVLA